MLVFSVFCGLCLPLMSQYKVVELSVLDMVCGLSVLEAAIQCRTGQLSRRADRLTGVNSTGFSLIQTSHSPQCFKNRWLTLIHHTLNRVHIHTHTSTPSEKRSLPQRRGRIQASLSMQVLTSAYSHVCMYVCTGASHVVMFRENALLPAEMYI